MRRRQALTLLVLLGIVAAACNGSAEPTTTTSVAVATTTTTSTLPRNTTTTVAEVSTTVGAAGIGDEYYPLLGNGGYDVAHYDLDLFFDPASNLLDAAAVISATATQDLTTFNLDFIGFDITDLRVGDLPARFERTGHELVITPMEPLTSGQQFDVTVAYAGNPESIDSPAFPQASVGWNRGPNAERYVVAEPDAANSWFPTNDHPLDKATFRYTVTVPNGWAVGSTGEFLGTEPGHQVGDTLTYTWDMDEPMAPYLATVIIGEGYELVDDPVSTAAAGVPIRNFLPPDLIDNEPSVLSKTGEMLRVLEEAFGPYPFDRYGITVVGGFPAALENQTMSIFGRVMVDAPFFEDVLVHELAHQWFGNSVSVAQWKDIWLNEGFATYAELLWTEARQGHGGYEDAVANLSQAASAAGFPAPGTPPRNNLFNGGVYLLGGLLLADLREEIGDDSFFTLLRTYATEFADGNATTADFVSLAEEISGQDLGEFFDTRLF